MSVRTVPETFREGSEVCGLQPSTGPVIVGMSGGCDSMTLGHLLHEAGYQIIGAHVNYRLRKESAEEEHLVREWCTQRHVECRVLDAAELTIPDSGLQAWARDIRYTFFGELAKQYGARTVAVAHHADDQLETMLMNLERGTGPAGLAGMRPARPLFSGRTVALVRPMLGIPGTAIRDYASKTGIRWRDDASNETDAYTRNVFRKELSLLSADERDDLLAAATSLSGRLREVRVRIEDIVQDQELLPFESLDELPAWLAEWVVMEWTSLRASGMPRRRSLAQELLSLRTSQTGRRVEVDGVTVWRERTGLRIETAAPAPEPAIVTLPDPGDMATIAFDDGRLVLERLEPTAGNVTPRTVASARGAGTVEVDAAAIHGSLLLRSWEAGDRFSPPGLKGHKKIKRFLTDEKVSPSRRARIPVLVDEEGIVWVVGQEIDSRAATGPSTEDRVRLRWVSGDSESEAN